MAGPVFVTGGTGAQGGAVARELLEAGYTVHIVARDPQSQAAQDLASLGIKVFPGNFDSIPDLTKAAEQCVACFVNVSPSFTDPHGERDHLFNILEACKATGVRHVVQSSVAKVDQYENGTFVDFDNSGFMAMYWASKSACEGLIRDASFVKTWAIVRPPRLLNSYVAPLANMMFPMLATNQTITTAIKPALRQDCVDPLDVGKAVKEILAQPTKFHGKTITLTGVQMRFQKIVDAMNAALGAGKVTLDFIGEEEAQKMKKTNPIIGSEIFLNANRRADDAKNTSAFEYEPGLAEAYFRREVGALKRAVGEE